MAIDIIINTAEYVHFIYKFSNLDEMEEEHIVDTEDCSTVSLKVFSSYLRNDVEYI